MHAWNALPWFLHLINISLSSRLNPEDILGSLDYLPTAQCSRAPLTSIAVHTALCLPAYLLFPQLDNKFLTDGHCTLYLCVPSPSPEPGTCSIHVFQVRLVVDMYFLHRFYAGGSERSGQQIVGPPRKKSPNELVDDLFKGAKEHGAVAVERVTKSPGETSKPRPFAGGGYRLGAAPEEESAYVAGERRRHSGQDVHVVLKLWKSGFSLDNGELRSYQDPSNAQFLESIRRGEVPAELRRLAHGGQVNLDMEDHRDEDFVKPKGAFKAFTGEGQKLGSTAPQVLNTSSPAQQAENEAKASSSVSIDESQPTTNIQIRLADGGRLVQKFNHSHRISDIRLFIVDARPAMAATSFVLMTTFPNKELADESQTLKEANLLNAVIVQRLT
ncbi:NSFL1 cofactor p47 isoform X2 [Vulpes vulpes]|uniref:NSFL1 cofactor p47 isoform X2 n=1 Tax=Vulpes vulpes TaxID=9627 RepID=A0ABM4YPS4_VULVU